MRERHGNRTTTELRRTYRELSAEQRFALQLRLSRLGLELRDAGRRVRR